VPINGTSQDVSDALCLALDVEARVLAAFKRQGSRWLVCGQEALRPHVEVLVLLAAPQLSLQKLAVPAKAGEMWRKASRFALEDQLANELDANHIALPVRLKAPECQAAIIDVAWFKSWLELLAAQGLRPKQVYPAASLLNEAEFLHMEHGQVLFAADGERGCMQADAFSQVFQGEDLHARQWPELASRLVQLEQLPALLSERFATRQVGAQKQRSLWRWSALMAAAALLLLVLAQTIKVYQLAGSEAKLEAQYLSELRAALGPETTLIPGSERLQLDTALASRASGQHSSFVALLRRVAIIVQGQVGLELKAVEYREGGLELALEGRDVRSFELFKDQLSREAGLQANLSDLNYGKATVSGRLRVDAP
jgi:general secretion pathway protein L